MRSLRGRKTWALTAALLAGFTPGGASAQNLPPVKGILDVPPVLKKWAEYETPPDAAALSACKVETVLNAQKRPVGYALRDGQGKLLRRFIDSEGKGGAEPVELLPGRIRGLSRERQE